MLISSLNHYIPFLWNPSGVLHVSTCLFKIWNLHIDTMHRVSSLLEYDPPTVVTYFQPWKVPTWFPCSFQSILISVLIYVVHTPTNALFINLVKSFRFTLKYTIILLLHRRRYVVKHNLITEV